MEGNGPRHLISPNVAPVHRTAEAAKSVGAGVLGVALAGAIELYVAALNVADRFRQPPAAA